MFEATGLKLCPRVHLQWHGLPAEFNVNLSIDSKVISGDKQTDRQTGDLLSLAYFLRGG
jgi:hypothetical protein